MENWKLSVWFSVSFFSCDLQDFKFKYVNRKAFGENFLYWVDFNQKSLFCWLYIPVLQKRGHASVKVWKQKERKRKMVLSCNYASCSKTAQLNWENLNLENRVLIVYLHCVLHKYWHTWFLAGNYGNHKNWALSTQYCHVQLPFKFFDKLVKEKEV